MKTKIIDGQMYYHSDHINELTRRIAAISSKVEEANDAIEVLHRLCLAAISVINLIDPNSLDDEGKAALEDYKIVVGQLKQFAKEANRD